VLEPVAQPSNDNEAPLLPSAIRWNDKHDRWDWWSKNLKTRTKALKQAAASGISTSFTKGKFVPVKVGEGWATAPNQPEVVNDQLVTSGIRLFLCLPMETDDTGDHHLSEVIDVTTWFTKSLLPVPVREFCQMTPNAVDSGK